MSTLQIIGIIAAAIIISTVAAHGPTPAPMVASGSGPSSAPGPISSFGPSAPEPTSNNDCLTPLLNMSDCLTYVEQGSNMTKPDKNCCPELAGLFDSHPICLCEMLGSNITEQYGIKLDLSRALKLPSICRVSTPPVSMCSAVGYPVPAPLSGPSDPASAAGGHSPAAGPSIGSNQNSRASSIAVPAHTFFASLAFAVLLTII